MPHGDELPRVLQHREPVQPLRLAPDAFPESHFADEHVGGFPERTHRILAVACVIGAGSSDWCLR